MIESLRMATKSLHEDLEKKNIARRIIDNNISMEEYKLLLLQNFIAYRTAERAMRTYLPEVEEISKHEKLEMDLKYFDIDLPLLFDFEKEFVCQNKIQALGTAYVVEGSALGGMLISKELKNCNELQGMPDQHFFSGDRKSAEGWARFLKLIRNSQFSENEKEEASEKAKETFLLFKKAFGVHLSV